MSFGGTDLRDLICDLAPVVSRRRFVFCSVETGTKLDIHSLDPDVIVKEQEGTTLIMERSVAEKHASEMTIAPGAFRRITCKVHSSLDAVGLTAAISKALTEVRVSANVVAGFYHDHVYVPEASYDSAHQAICDLMHEYRDSCGWYIHNGGDPYKPYAAFEEEP